MDEAVFKSKSVDEWLERRTRRPQRFSHVDLASAAHIEIIRRTDAGHDLAGRIIDRENCQRDIRAERRGKHTFALARELLQVSLHCPIDGKSMLLPLRRFGDRA